MHDQPSCSQPTPSWCCCLACGFSGIQIREGPPLLLKVVALILSSESSAGGEQDGYAVLGMPSWIPQATNSLVAEHIV